MIDPGMPSGWETVGRIAFIIGMAGMVGAVGKLIATWLRNRGGPPPD
jgi:hypothetical protein